MNDRDYFPPSLADARRAAWYVPFLRALGETPLQSAQPLAIRLLCLPTCGGASCIRVEDCGIRWRCSIGELDGDAGYEVGKLVRREHFEMTSIQTARLEEMWHYLRFWEQPATVEEAGEFDGTEYALEAIEGNRHGLVCRVSGWEWGDTFGEFVDALFDVSGLRGG